MHGKRKNKERVAEVCVNNGQQNFRMPPQVVQVNRLDQFCTSKPYDDVVLFLFQIFVFLFDIVPFNMNMIYFFIFQKACFHKRYLLPLARILYTDIFIHYVQIYISGTRIATQNNTNIDKHNPCPRL